MTRTYLGLALAGGLWGIVFGLKPLNFWADLAGASILIAAFAVCLGGEELRGRFFYKAGMIMAGIASAVFLYVAFIIGAWASSAVLPFTPGEIAEIYQIRVLTPRWVTVLLLAAVVAPCEEIFWRGFFQSTLAYRFGDVRGWLLMAVAYALVHVWAWNLVLVISALICGLFWGFLFYRLKSLVPCIISHALWDLAVFVYYPIPN